MEVACENVGPELRPKLKKTPAADLGDVAIEQLMYLVEHGRGGLHLNCDDCHRYVAARAILLEPFEATKPKAKVVAIDQAAFFRP